MIDNRAAAFLLVAGSAAGLVTMVTHPTGHDVIRNASMDDPNTLVRGVHALALVGQPLLLAGTLGLSTHLRSQRALATTAWLFFAMAAVAVLIAAAASGFVAPQVLRGFAQADEAARATMLSALRYTGALNQAFAQIYVLLTGMALVLWSAAIWRGRELPRGLAVYGAVVGVAFVVGIIAGVLPLDIHGFGAVVLAQSVWMVVGAVTLRRRG
jgi:hypothetical protein